jgi:cytochrome c-type biogenesis protein CcmH/NrfF
LEEDKQMKKRMTPMINTLVFIILMGAFLAACGSSSSTASSSSGSSSSDSAGQILMQARCSVCHSVNRVESAHHTAAEWKVTVERMINKGAQLTPQEQQTLINYLARNYK